MHYFGTYCEKQNVFLRLGPRLIPNMTASVELSNELLYKICIIAECKDLRALSAVNRRHHFAATPILDNYSRIFGDRPNTAF
jgi:hypothetical protein